ncbi:alanine racemase [Zhengella mangrovi]|uniref:Alanine racemase n=1 Tax=Zhengella mangrovi TaxID=1982044 RepID=A0A2G1QSF4_9HYPH|nr:alanine racemase [Zhengella mangrovi]
MATARLTVDLDALAWNYRLLAEWSGQANAAAVVKADAYGTGLEQAGTALAGAGCETFFVAVPEEAVRLKRVLPGAQVFVLSGIFDEESAAVVAEAGAVPILNSLDQIDLWAGYWKARGSRRPCAIHVDTGMNRLGLSEAEALAFADRNARDHLVTPILLMSHLACADQRDHPLNRQQLDTFQRVRSAFGDIESSLANSAGVFLGSDYHFELTRPGIALYGGEAASGMANPMRAVVRAEARILQVRRVRAGEPVSYGAAQALERDSLVAVCGAGYADGYHRAGSGAGVPLRGSVAGGFHGALAGHRVPVVGRVTMDLTLFDITDVPDAGIAGAEWIELFGGTIPLDDAARAAGTIGYELLTSLGARYHRRHVGG